MRNLVTLICWVIPALIVRAEQVADSSHELVQEVRVVWGGTQSRSFEGTLAIQDGSISLIRNLSMQDDALGAVRQLDQQKIELAQRSASNFGGMDVIIRGTDSSRLKLSLKNSTTGKMDERTVSLSEFQQKSWIEVLDDAGTRVAIERQISDKLRVQYEGGPLDSNASVGAGSQRILQCGSIWTPVISGFRTGLSAGEYRLIGSWAGKSALGKGQGNVIDQTIQIDAAGNFSQIRPEIQVPTFESAYRLELTVIKPNLMSAIAGSKTLLQRSVEVVAFDATAKSEVIANWRPIMAVDTAAAIKPEGLSWITSFTGNLTSRALEVPDSLLLPGIDLTQQINRLLPISRKVTQYAAISKGGLVSVRDYQVQQADRPQRTTVLGPGAWISLPIHNLTADQPHRLRVQIPADHPSSLSVSVRDMQGETESLLDPQSCVEVKQDDTGSGLTLTHDFLFWPRYSEASILVANADKIRSAFVGNILVETAELTPDTAPKSEPLERPVAIYIDQPLIADSLAAPRERDPASGRYYETWRTWQAVAERLVLSAQATGANTIVLSGIAGANSLIPLRSVHQLHRLDKGVFFSDGRSPEMHDVIGLVLKHCERAGMKLILELDLGAASLTESSQNIKQSSLTDSAGKKAVAGNDGVGQVDLLRVLNQTGPRELSELYRPNPLSRSTQNALLEPLREVSQRYASYSSFAGVSLKLNSNSPFVFAGDRWGYNEELINEFATENGVTLPSNPQQRLQLFTGPARMRFVQWRAKQLSKLFSQIARELNQNNPGVKLYLNVIHLCGHVPSESDFVEPDLVVRNPKMLLASYGIDLESLTREPSIVVTQGVVRHSKQLVGATDWFKVANSDWPLSGSTLPNQAVLVTHQPRAQRLSTETEKPLGSGEPWIYPDAARQGRQAARVLLEQIWPADARLVGFGGWHPVWIGDPQIRGLVRVFKRLPPVPMSDLQSLPKDSPVKIRTAEFQGKTYLCLINLSSWDANVQLQTAVSAQGLDSYSSEFADGASLDKSDLHLGSSDITLRIPSCGMVLLTHDNPKALDVISSSCQLPGGIITEIAENIDRLENLVTRAADPGKQRLLLGVGGTFEQWTTDGKPIGWNVSTLPNTRISQTSELPHSGGSSVLMENRNDEPIAAWIQSKPIDLPETGRLTLRAWLRTSAANQAQPLARLSLVGRLSNGQRYQRSVLYGGSTANPQKALSIDWGRRPYELHVTDIPVEEMLELQVAIDLIGPGRIWVDDVEVVQTWLHPDERNYLRGQLLVAKERLSAESPFVADQLLHSPWSEYLFELGSSIDQHYVNVVSNRSTQAKVNQLSESRSKSDRPGLTMGTASSVSKPNTISSAAADKQPEQVESKIKSGYTQPNTDLRSEITQVEAATTNIQSDKTDSSKTKGTFQQWRESLWPRWNR